MHRNGTVEFTPKEVGAIIGAYTGFLCGKFEDMHAYVEKLLGHPVFTHEMGSPAMEAKIKEAAKADFVRLGEWCSKD
jgi:hypothetical protein